MTMSFNGLLFEDLNQRLKNLSELLSIPAKSKDPGINCINQEARIYGFLTCHNTMNDLLVSIYEGSDLGKKENANPKNAPGEVLSWMLSEKMITKDQVVLVAQQYDVASLLAYDSSWLSGPEDKKMFLDMVNKLPRYYYVMNTFVQSFSKRLVFYKEKSNETR